MHHARARSFCLSCCLFLICSIQFSSESWLSRRASGKDDDRPALPRDIYDMRLFCPNPLPKTRYGTMYPLPDRAGRVALAAWGIEYPPDWSYLNFSSLTDLCSAQGRFGMNMGGQVWLRNPQCLSHVREPFILTSRTRFPCSVSGGQP